MRRTRVIGAVVVAGVLGLAAARLGWNLHRVFGRDAAPTPTLAGTQQEKRILAAIREMQTAHKTFMEVAESDGQMLRVLTEAVNAKNVVEVGTSTGYSGLWLSLALQRTGGKLTTFEIDRGRAAIAQEYFKKAGVDQQVTIVLGDAHKRLLELRDPIDVVFLDADKGGYIDCFNKLLPLVRQGGLILAHNVDMVPDYVRLVTANPELETVFFTQGGGLSITLKKRRGRE
jgi:caffeoyl-CoA O-methyltransferase